MKEIDLIPGDKYAFLLTLVRPVALTDVWYNQQTGERVDISNYRGTLWWGQFGHSTGLVLVCIDDLAKLGEPIRIPAPGSAHSPCYTDAVGTESCKATTQTKAP